MAVVLVVNLATTVDKVVPSKACGNKKLWLKTGTMSHEWWFYVV